MRLTNFYLKLNGSGTLVQLPIWFCWSIRAYLHMLIIITLQHCIYFNMHTLSVALPYIISYK